MSRWAPVIGGTEWSSPAWLTQGDAVGPAAPSLCVPLPCPCSLDSSAHWGPKDMPRGCAHCFSLCNCLFGDLIGVSWVQREGHSRSTSNATEATRHRGSLWGA